MTIHEPHRLGGRSAIREEGRRKKEEGRRKKKEKEKTAFSTNANSCFIQIVLK
jgi:hypothetical protein